LVTNLRRGRHAKAPASRGRLVLDFIKSNQTARSYMTWILPRINDYAPFCFVAGEVNGEISMLTSTRGFESLTPGLHTVSNAGVDQGWPKERRLARHLEDSLERSDGEDALLAGLSDKSGADDAELPETGVGIALERILAPIFVAAPGYGTRASTLVICRRDGAVTMRERAFSEDGAVRSDERVLLPAPIPAP
jgi:uncharacterized protein with NRDE domain